MDYNESVKRLKEIDISHKMGDYRDHTKVEIFVDRIQEFKSRFQKIRQNLAASKKKITIEETDETVKIPKLTSKDTDLSPEIQEISRETDFISKIYEINGESNKTTKFVPIWAQIFSPVIVGNQWKTTWARVNNQITPDRDMSCVIEVFPSDPNMVESATEINSLIESKLKAVEQRVKNLDKIIGLKDLKSDFVLDNKLFQTVCNLREYLFSVAAGGV